MVDLVSTGTGRNVYGACMSMKRRRVTRRTAGGAVEASSGSIVIDNAYNSNDHASAFAVANLPKIPGLTIEHVPSFLHILRVTSKFFQTKRTKQPFTIVDWEMLNNNNRSINDWNSRDEITANKNVPKTVHDSIMDRMKASSSTAPANDDEFQRKFVEAVNNWMNDVEILARRRKKQQPIDGASAATTTIDSGKHQQLPEKENVSQSIPYSMFLYLWEMQQQHKRMTVRRSALFLSGLLLLRSKDCRFHLDQETHLADWVSNIGVKIDGSSSSTSRDSAHDSSEARKNSNRKIVQHAFLQKEAIALISHLVDKGFGRMYAKLAVAAKSLRHQCTTNTSSLLETTTSTITTPPGMANWRKLRDFALLHGPKEIQKVRKLLDRADECLEILVPRIEGVRRPSPSSTSGGNGQSVYGENGDDGNINGDEDSSDGDDIDWEDGNEIEKNGAKPASNEQNVHLSAVEITMAAMEKTGSTLFSGGLLEIDFDRRVDDEECGNNDGVVSGSDNLSSNVNKARGKLEKIVQKLSNRHLVRLSAWLDGLRNSDNLVVRVESASLVSLSPGNNDLRLELISRLSVLRQDVSTVISSASRLNIDAHNKGMNNQAHAARSAQNLAKNPNANVVASLEGVQAVSTSSARAELSKKRTPKTKNKQNRSRRIQINYKK